MVSREGCDEVIDRKTHDCGMEERKEDGVEKRGGGEDEISSSP